MGRDGQQREALQAERVSAVWARTNRRRLSGRASLAGWALAMGLSAGVCLESRHAYAQEEPASDGAEEGSGEEAASAPPTEVQLKLDQATKQIEQLDYPAAQQSLFEVVQSGKATSAELAQAYFSLGTVEAGLGNDVESTDSFYLALMIQPSLLFPEGGSPKIRERLNEARGRVTEVGVLQLRASVDDGVLDVRLDNDPLNLVKRVDVTMTRAGGESGKVTLEKGDRGEMRAEVESGVQTIQVVAHDEAGNQLKVLDVDPAASGPGGGAEDIGTPPSIWASWGLWAGVAGALAIGGTYFIMEASDLDGDIRAALDAPVPNDAEVRRLQENQDRVGMYGVIGLSMAGAAAVTSGALLLFGGGDEAKPEAEARIVPSIAPGHYGARFSLKF